MADKQYGSSLPGYRIHLPLTLPLKLCVPNREDFVNDEDFRFQVGCHCKGESDIHAGRVSLDRSVQKPLDLQATKKHQDYVSLLEKLIEDEEI